MRSVAFALAILAAGTVTASAQIRSTHTCSREGHTRTCSFFTYEVAPRGPIVQSVAEPEDREASAARVAKWEAYCQPRAVADKLGVSRYVYAHEGCDTGRSE